jgi:hypothetical protein
MSDLKEKLYHELHLKLDVIASGVSIDAEDVKKLDLAKGNRLSPGQLSRGGFSFDFVDSLIPSQQLTAYIKKESLYGIELDGNTPVLYKYGRHKTPISEIKFKEQFKQPEIMNRLTSDGVPYYTIASIADDGKVHVNYSQECVLKDKGVDCYFCNYSNREATLKTPKQVGEVFSQLYLAGLGKHLNLTSGFLHERRELEFYLDVADEIKSRTGLNEFRATAIVGPSTDLSTIEKYKEAGFFSIRMNIEIWDKNIWKALCPGKDLYCGGWDNWVRSLEHAVDVFGKGKVGSNLVGGIEPKKSALEGAEYKISRGIVASASNFRPTEGSYLEGTSTPTAAWHFDLQKRIADLWLKYGFTFDDLHNVSPGVGFASIIYQIETNDIENGKLRTWKYPELSTVQA